MKPLAVINDNHIGTMRSAGTTAHTAKALRLFGLDQLKNTLAKIDTDLVVNGDFFDGFQVPLSDALAALELMEAWLEKGHKLTFLPGNHDLSNDSSKLSTFEFVARILKRHKNVNSFQGGGWVDEESGVYAITHVPNQDLFNLELSKVPQCRYLLLHCNWDNGFAKEADHSLNLSREVAAQLPAGQIILGHEHASACHMGTKVWIAGVQWPMSISDCLDKQSKGFLTLHDEGPVFNTTWDSANYQEVDWRNASAANAQFIRVVGNADQTEAAEAVEAVARLRRVSEAFIIGSAVRFKSGDEIDMAEALASVEDVRAFDVMGALKDILQPEQVKVLEGLK
jgi:calcineurin-like phosphoesterase family protein